MRRFIPIVILLGSHCNQFNNIRKYTSSYEERCNVIETITEIRMEWIEHEILIADSVERVKELEEFQRKWEEFLLGEIYKIEDNSTNIEDLTEVFKQLHVIFIELFNSEFYFREVTLLHKKCLALEEIGFVPRGECL